MRSLYILKIRLLSEVSLANIFSHTDGYLCVWMLFVFCFCFCFLIFGVQKLFILMRSHLFILSFMSLALGDILVKRLLCGISHIFPLMVYCRTFLVSWLIFKSFIHLEFIFEYGVSWLSNVFFLHIVVQISQHHLLKRLFLFHFMLFLPLSNINWP